MEKIVVILCLLLSCTSVVEGLEVYKIALNFMIRFHSKEVLAMIANSTAHESRRGSAIEYDTPQSDPLKKQKKDKRAYGSNFNVESPLYNTNTYNIPVNQYIKGAMLAILGEDGVLQKGGFYMDGYIKKDGSAFIQMVKSFGSRKNLINEIKNARLKKTGQDPLTIIVHLLLTKEDTDNLITWQEEQIRKGNLKQDDMCAPKMIVMYKCCTATVLPYIGPLFGSLQIGSD